MKLLSLLFLALASGTLACHSPARTEGVECVCGQPLADVQGCPHAACAAGHNNPDNPDCVCGTLSLSR